MRFRKFCFVLTLISLALNATGSSAQQPSSPSPRYDILITGGSLIDGTGAPSRRADIGIKGDRIVAVSTLVRDAATFIDPHQYPVGIETVIVNGVIAVERSRPTGARAGRVLTPRP